MHPPIRLGVFLSLKWKAMLLSSIALILVTGTLVTINYIELRNQFEQRRAELQNQYVRQVQGLLNQSDMRLRQWSTLVASLLGAQSPAENSPNRMIAEFERLAGILELDMGVESVVLVAADGRRLAAHGRDAHSDGRIALAEAVQRVLASENPASLIDCFDTCLQYAVAPVLGTGDALVLGVSLADVVLDFQRVSGTDLGLIVGQAGTAPKNGDGERWLQPWGAKVAALSSARTNMLILRAVARERTLSESAKKSIHSSVNGREYEVRLFPLAGFDEREEAHLVVVADISDAMAKIRAALRHNLALGTVGLVLSELLLLAILWAPLSRLRYAAAKLPWLAEGEFAKIRAMISETGFTHFFRDEVDVLNETAIAVSHQLEALSSEVAQQTRDLSEQMNEIVQQRNFVTHVLETAQAIILTQDRNNRILMINPYGQSLTGYSLSDLAGKPFVDLLARKESADTVQNHLSDLVAGVREHIEEECNIRCKDQSALNIVWQHSRLREQTDDAPLILSVGMDITARKKAEMRLAWLADHDSLTGLYNRRRFTRELNDAVAAARRYRRTGALLFLDLDQFKYINDTSGHHAGDRLLQRLGELLPSILREVDVIGRLGGDEFAVILNQATADEAVQVTKKILAHICEIEFPVGEQIHKLSASIGIALFPDHGTTTETLLQRADIAMYRAKSRQHAVELYSPEQDHHSRRRLNLLADLRIRLDPARLGQRHLPIRRLDLIGVGHDLPAPERFVVAGAPVDRHPHVGIALVAFFRRRGQRHFQGAENDLLADPFLVGDGIHHQQNLFVAFFAVFYAHVVLPPSRIRTPAIPLLKFGDQASLLDSLQRHPPFPALGVDDHHLVVAHPEQPSDQFPPPVQQFSQLNPHLRAGETDEVPGLEQGAIQPRRGHFQGVSPRDRVLDIQHAAELVADALAVVQRDAGFAVDIDPQQGAVAAGVKLHPDQFVAHGFHHGR